MFTQGECSYYHPFHHPVSIITNNEPGGVAGGLPQVLEVTTMGVRCKVRGKTISFFSAMSISRNDVITWFVCL